MSDEEEREKETRFRSLGQDGMDGILERHGERSAAQAASMEKRMTAQVAQAAERMAAQAAQFNQLMAAFKQSQAAGHGEGGLGLAKGDG